jgi:hypothetical protein
MKTNSIVAMAAVMSHLMQVCNLCWAAEESVPSTSARFIPDIYIQYQRSGMTTQELVSVRNADSNYINKLLEDLHKYIPEYAGWLQRGVINENPNLTSAHMLQLLADNSVPFTKEQIDLIVTGLDHADSGVIKQIETTLVQLFGISFIEGENNWPYKSEEIRQPYTETWKKFWKQNRDRYCKGLPWVLNDLSLTAQIVTNGTDRYVAITITNIGETDWRVYTEVVGRLTPGKPPEHGLPEWPFSIFVDGHEEHPVIPTAYNWYYSPHVIGLLENQTNGRPAHLDRITLPSAKSYTYVLKLAEAFPQLNNRPAYTNLIVRYQYGLYGTHKDEPVWRGELRSQPIPVR